VGRKGTKKEKDNAEAQRTQRSAEKRSRAEIKNFGVPTFLLDAAVSMLGEKTEMELLVMLEGDPRVLRIKGKQRTCGRMACIKGNKEVTEEVASGGWLVASRRRVGEGVGRSEMAQERCPLSMTDGA